MHVTCPDCGQRKQLTPQDWRCQCGATWDLQEKINFQPEYIQPNEQTIWRYHKFIDHDNLLNPISLGAGGTPLIPLQYDGMSVWLKMEYLNPTGSFKDRGVELMMNWLKAHSITHVVEDSSGNAGASVAAYAARLGMQADIYVPADASPAKLAQITIFGANVHSISGPRIEATNAAIATLNDEVAYASHAYHPMYLLGQQTAAWEIWEQMNGQGPDWCVVPVGQGGQLLGLFYGFQCLLEVGLINTIPRLIAVQASNLAPLGYAMQQSEEIWPEMHQRQSSVADGIQISHPVRWRQLLRAIKNSNGLCVDVSEEDILINQKQLAKMGFFVEPTSAVVLSALHTIKEKVTRKEKVVLSLTGNGLKKQAVVKN